MIHRSTTKVTAPTTSSLPATTWPSSVRKPRLRLISRAGAPPVTSTIAETTIVRGHPTGTPSNRRLTAPRSNVLSTNQTKSRPEVTWSSRELPARRV